MKIGISTASLYPLHTEEALLETARLPVKNVEIFLNSVSELEGEVFSCIRETVNKYEMNVISVHPFSSPMESLFLFSSYDRRVTEIMDLYKRYFQMMSRINAKIFVVHGVVATGKCPDERYVERLYALIKAGRDLGVTVAQENVGYCKSGRLEFLQMLSRELGDFVSFVLDVKQARRANVKPLKIIEELGSKIVHLHLSDSNYNEECMPIGKGNFDFKSFFAQLKQVGYTGDAVVELYRNNYSEYGELKHCVDFLEKLL
ncbi:MAG: sugar phosphate isomerase/epimerase [Oscillospiraceae bacterium]|nr:sugar phosphate isomerase/epimerase [Oscillospiraceae bacterium]